LHGFQICSVRILGIRDTNRYEVLEKYDEVENEVEIGTKVQFE